MKTAPIKFIGGNKTSRSKFWSASSTVNFYIEADPDQDARTPGSLLPWPGESLYSSGLPTGVARGMHEHLGVLYVVVGEVLYRIKEGGSSSSIGALPGYERVVMVSDGVVLVMVTHNTIYTLDVDTITEV